MTHAMPLVISCFGQFQALIDGRLLRFSTDHARALLAYLAVEADKTHSRAHLASLLWPERPELHAMQSLRQTLLRLRQSLNEVGASPSLLQITAKTIQFSSDAAVLDLIDVRRFQQYLAACKAHDQHRLEECPECIQRLEQAAEVYKGDFLQGLALRNSQPFDEWAGHLREQLHRQALAVLYALGNIHEEHGDVERARNYVARQLLLEPWLEEAHRQMMRLLARSGQVAAALRQYESCRRILQQELGVAPAAETTLLYEQIRAGGIDPVEAPAEAVITRAGWEEVPVLGHLYGRDAELAQLATWLVRERSQLIVILGMGGIGKTALAAAAVEAAASHFDLLLWRSLLNAPPLDEILRDWFALLVPEHMSDLPESLDAQLGILLQALRKRRCLLVLDNVESIFQPGQAGESWPEFRGYGQLFQRVAEVRHQSCLLLTSREQPHVIASFVEDMGRVRSLHIEGLDSRAIQALLAERAFAVQSAQATALMNRYSGNPLALKLVADTIQELFNHDIAAFLATEVVIFDDIRSLLDQQFDRLTPLERELLMWIAIEREPAALESLRGNLTPMRPLPEVVQTLRALQRRSFLERAAGAPRKVPPSSAPSRDPASMQSKQGFTAPNFSGPYFAVPNVVMEYLVDRLVEAAGDEIEQEQLFWLHSHALIQAQTKEYLRQSQVRLILQRIANGLIERWGRGETERKLLHLLHLLQSDPRRRGYGAGNLLNLLILLEVDLTGLDLSGLPIWQADLRKANLAGANFAQADLTHSRFADAFGHIFDVACSPDSALVAACMLSGEIYLWRMANGQLLHSFKAHTGQILSIAFRADGQVLASGGEDRMVRLWSIQDLLTPGTGITPTERRPFARLLTGHTGRVTSVVFHPNGETLASASVDGTIRLWDVASGKVRAILQGHEHWVWSLAYSPDGRILASGSFDRTIRLWDAHTGQLASTLTGHQGVVSTLAFDPSGRHLASGSFDGSIYLWEIAGGQLLYTLATSGEMIRSVAFSPDGELLADAREDGSIHLWNHQSGAHTRVLHTHTDGAMAAVFSPDGKTLVSGGLDQMICSWDLATGRVRQQLVGYSQQIGALAFHPDGKSLASGHYDRTVRLWDLHHQALQQSLYGHTHSVTNLAFSRDGALLASSGDDMAVHVWTVTREKTTHRYLLRAHPKRVWALAFQPDGEALASGGEDLTLCLWNLESGQLLRVKQMHESQIFALALSPDCTFMAGGGTPDIQLWDVQSSQLYATLPSHATVMSLAFSPDGQWLASGGGDGVISLWNICAPTQPRLVHTLHGHSDRVLTLAFDAQGKLLASGGADRTLCLWEMHMHELLHRLVGHSGWITSVAISPDACTIASGGFDESIRLWDSRSGVCHTVLRSPRLYEGLNISGVTGIGEAEKAILKRLGAVER